MVTSSAVVGSSAISRSGSHIKAKAIITELQGGADFAELAQAKSTGPSGPNGGALGWFGPGMMVKEFEDAVTGMEPGDVAGPIQTKFATLLGAAEIERADVSAIDPNVLSDPAILD